MHIFVFPQSVEKQVEKQKILGTAVFFHLLINFPFFNRLRDEKIISHLLYTYSAFRFFSFALQGSTAFSDFHISLHIFSFSTGHLFKKIHNRFAPASFPQNQNLFPHLFPSEKSRKRKDEKPCGICVFGTFPTFLQTLSPLLLKNS